MASKSDPPPQGFFGLPPEIRKMIYEQALDQSRILITNEYSPKHGRSAYKAYNAPALLFVCHLIHLEAIPKVYTESHFVFDFGEKPVFGINAFARRAGSINASLIRKITIRLDDFYTRETCYKYNNPLQRLYGWVRHFPQLQELRLKYAVEVPSHHFLVGEIMTALNVVRYGELFNRMLVLLESRRKDTGRYEQVWPTRMGKFVERLFLTHDYLRVEYFMVFSRPLAPSWYFPAHLS